MRNWIHFGAQCHQKYALHKKKGLNKNCSELNFVQKSRRVRMSTSPASGIGAPKDQCIGNLIMYRNGKSPLAPLLGETDKCAY